VSTTTAAAAGGGDGVPAPTGLKKFDMLFFDRLNYEIWSAVVVALPNNFQVATAHCPLPSCHCPHQNLRHFRTNQMSLLT
jgi:hypothetical protein